MMKTGVLNVRTEQSVSYIYMGLPDTEMVDLVLRDDTQYTKAEQADLLNITPTRLKTALENLSNGKGAGAEGSNIYLYNVNATRLKHEFA